MKLTLIITTYNRPDSLELVLKSVENQKIIPEEVIIADDGSNNKTKNLIKRINKDSKVNFIHSWQRDDGFRAARSRNKAILKSTGDYIILIDGDMILHPSFIKDHIINAELGYFIQGTRVLLSEEKTKKILDSKLIYFSFFSNGISNRKNLIHSKILSIIFSNKKNHLHGIKSCNMGFYREDFFKVNGFNNEFEGWGREDSEFVVRLINSGVKRKNVRFNAIQFHMWHNENTRISLEKNDLMLKASIVNHNQWCKNGVNLIKNNES
jgi:glycosyltransferase involved in cell wall biosynthesis